MPLGTMSARRAVAPVGGPDSNSLNYGLNGEVFHAAAGTANGYTMNYGVAGEVFHAAVYP